MVMSRCLNGSSARVIKEVWCTANIMTHNFADAHKDKLHFCSILTDMCHCKQDYGEFATRVVMNGTIKIDSYMSSRSWIVADTRYDVVMGISCHMNDSPQRIYKNCVAIVDNHGLLAMYASCQDWLTIRTVQVNRFPRRLRFSKLVTCILLAVQEISCKTTLLPNSFEDREGVAEFGRRKAGSAR